MNLPNSNFEGKLGEDVLKRACNEIVLSAFEGPPKNIDFKIHYSVIEQMIYVTFDQPAEISYYDKYGGPVPENYEEYCLWNLEIHNICKKVASYYKLAGFSVSKSFGGVTDAKLFRQIKF